MHTPKNTWSYLQGNAMIISIHIQKACKYNFVEDGNWFFFVFFWGFFGLFRAAPVAYGGPQARG